MFTFGDILKWMPGTKPQEYTYFSWDCRSEHCIQLQSYHRELENLVSLTSNLKEVENDEERKQFINSLPPVPELPKISPPKRNIIDDMELSDDSITSLLSKAVARVCFLVGYTDAPPHLLEELSKILKDYLNCLIFKSSISGGSITLESLVKALQEFGINGIEELHSYYFNRILKFHYSLYSKCKELRNEFENNLKTPPECPNIKHFCKRKKCKYQETEEMIDFREEKQHEEEKEEDFSIETGETIEVLYIKRQRKILNLREEKNKSDIKKIKCDLDTSLSNQNPSSSDSKPLVNTKEETSSNFESSKCIKNSQNCVTKKEFEESDKKLLDKYAAFFTFVPMTRKSKVIEKSNVNSEKDIQEDQVKKELNVNTDNTETCKDNKFFSASETTGKLNNPSETTETNCKLKKELQLNTDDTDKYNSLITKEKNRCFSVSENLLIGSYVDEAKKLSETSKELSNISNSVLSAVKKKDNDVFNKMSSKQEELREINTSEEFRFKISLKNNEILFRENCEKDVSPLNIYKSNCSSKADEEKNHINASNMISRTLNHLPSTVNCSTNDSRSQNGEQSLKSDFEKTEHQSKRTIRASLKKKKSHARNVFLKCGKTQKEIISDSDNNSIKNFNESNSELSYASCDISAMKSKKDLLVNTNDFICSKDSVDNKATLSDSDNKTLDQSLSSTNDLNRNFKQHSTKRKHKLKENAKSPKSNSNKRKCTNTPNKND